MYKIYREPFLWPRGRGDEGTRGRGVRYERRVRLPDLIYPLTHPWDLYFDVLSPVTARTLICITYLAFCTCSSISSSSGCVCVYVCMCVCTHYLQVCLTQSRWFSSSLAVSMSLRTLLIASLIGPILPIPYTPSPPCHLRPPPCLSIPPNPLLSAALLLLHHCLVSFNC